MLKATLVVILRTSSDC